MSTYAQLKSEIESLQARANEVLKAEKATAVAEIQRRIVQFGITAADLGLETRKVGRPTKRSNDAAREDEAADAMAVGAAAAVASAAASARTSAVDPVAG
jgi:hypothetical protein